MSKAEFKARLEGNWCDVHNRTQQECLERFGEQRWQDWCEWQAAALPKSAQGHLRIMQMLNRV